MVNNFKKKKILFLCTGNSCRSQMAEGWGRYLHGDKADFFSAGVEEHGLNPLAVKVMAEAGVDISNHFSKTIDKLEGIKFDLVITVCGNADHNCPVFPGKTKVIHHGFADPPKLALTAASEEDALDNYWQVRDEIYLYIEGLLI
jgi:arsenate reductase